MPGINKRCPKCGRKNEGRRSYSRFKRHPMTAVNKIAHNTNCRTSYDSLCTALPSWNPEEVRAALNWGVEMGIIRWASKKRGGMYEGVPE